jgi:hypothetical protein
VVDLEPGVRRLCIGVAAGKPGLLLSAFRFGEFDRVYTRVDPGSDTEMGVAPPGVDEMRLVRDLVQVLRREMSADPGPARPALVVLHVGIIRIVGDGFGGAGLIRIQSLIRDPAVRAAVIDAAGTQGSAGQGRGAQGSAGQRRGARLSLVISDGLFADLCAEGVSRQGWQRVSRAGAWLRSLPPAPGPAEEWINF